MIDARFGKTRTRNEVVGVVADVRYDLRKPPAPTIYILLPLSSFRTLHLRVAGDAGVLGARLREEVRATAPLVRVTSITSQAAMIDRTVVRERLLALSCGRALRFPLREDDAVRGRALRRLECRAATRHAAGRSVSGCRRSRLASGSRRSGHRVAQRVVDSVVESLTPQPLRHVSAR